MPLAKLERVPWARLLPSMPRFARTLLLWAVLCGLFFLCYRAFADQGAEGSREENSETFFTDLETGTLAEVSVDRAHRVYARRSDGGTYRTSLTYTEVLAEQVAAAHVPVTTHSSDDSPPPSTSWLAAALPTALPIVILVGAFAGLLVYLRRRSGGVGGILALRRSPARLVAQRPKLGWADVGGATEAKAHLQDTLDFLKNPEKWEKAGARAPRGILLEGPPGFGKTLLAKALAAEAALPFFEASGSEFVELFVGVGAARVRDLFEIAAKRAPCLVFIDELDAVGRKRGGASATLTHQEREQALDQLLVCLDGFRARDRVVVIAATNRADVLDPALLRPGRFDTILRVGDFSVEDRHAVLRIHARGMPVGPDVALERVAERTPAASGAELAQVCNLAAMAAARRSAQNSSAPLVTQADFERALAARAPKPSQLDRLDALLAEASWSLTQPTAPIEAAVHLKSGIHLTGQVLWADPSWLKLRAPDGPILVSRAEIASLRSHPATEAVSGAQLAQVRRTEEPDAG
jgi:cell division protease FtsH